MTDSPTPGFSGPEHPGNEEELVLWLLGELSPDEARRVAHDWRHRPDDVERWRRFLATTEKIGTSLRSHAEALGPRIPSPAEATVAPTPSSVEPVSPRRVPDRSSLREILRLLGATVPRRLVPVAVLAPIALIVTLWLTRIDFGIGVKGAQAFLNPLSPSVQVFDQGLRLPSGPVNAGAQVRFQGANAAARFSWVEDQCQAIVAGETVLLLTEPSFGLMQQEGSAEYDVIARERPLHLWTSEGTVEVAEARLRLAGTSSFLEYEILEGKVRLTSKGEWLSAGARGHWGRPSVPQFPELASGSPATPSEGEKGMQSAAEPAADKPGVPGSVASAAVESGSDVQVVDPASTIPATHGHHLFGRVTRSDNAPVPDARLVLVLIGENPEETRWRDQVSTTTGPDGLFHFRQLPEVREAFLRVDHDQLVSDKSIIPVTLDEEDVHVVLFEGSALAGRVIPPDGADYPGRLTMEVLDANAWPGRPGPPSPRTVGQERLHIEWQGNEFHVAGLSPGTYRLRVASDLGQTGESEDVEVGIEETRDGIEIALAPGGMFTGRVVKGDSPEGIPGATVGLFPPQGWGRGTPRRGGWGGRGQGPGAPAQATRDTSAERPKAKVVCDDKGEFTFSGLAPGAYEVRAAARSYIENRLVVRIKPGETREERIPLYGELGEVYGRVVDGEGRAIANVRITADHAEHLFDPKQTVTDGDGRYSVDLAYGHWNFRVQHPEDRAAWTQDSLLAETGVRVERNFVLFPGVRVFGTVTRAGQPVANTRLFFAGGGGSFQRGGGGGGNSTTTDDAGSYEILLRQGNYSVFVANQRRASLSLHDVTESRNDIVIADNLINGVVTDAETGEPIGDARLILEGTSSDSPDTILGFLGRSRFERSNDKGFYEFKTVDPGTYRVRAAADGYAETSISGVTVAVGDETVLNVPVSLTVASALLEVTCLDADSRDPVPGVIPWKVTSLDTGQDLFVSARPRFSDDRGFFLITNLRPGAYSITFLQVMGRGGRYLPATYPGVAVTAEQTGKLEIRLKKGGGLRVIVHRPADQDPSILIPVSQAQVRLIPGLPTNTQNLRLTDVTNTDGRVTFGPLADGMYSVDVNVPGFAPVLRPATIRAGETADLDIHLSPPTAVSTPATGPSSAPK